jgi:GT2 family glycosyltransferase
MYVVNNISMQEHTQDLSVIVVNWNTRVILQDCLYSIYKQAGSVNYEVVVVDNGSTDGSVEMVKEKFSQVRIIENSQNLGFARANNVGIRVATGRYICLINSDVTLLDDCIGRLTAFMDNHPNVGMAGPKILNCDGTVQHSCRHFPSIWNTFCQAVGLNRIFPKSELFSYWIMDYWDHSSTRKVDALSGCFWMIRREAMDKVGLLDENFFIYGEDLDWSRRFHNVGWDTVFYPEAQAMHLGAASSANAPVKFYIELQKADLQYWKKHHGRIGEISYAGIILLREIIRVAAGGLQYILQPSKRRLSGFKLQRSLASIRLLLHC